MPINMSNVTVGDSSITVIPVLSKWIFIDANESAISPFTISFLAAIVVLALVVPLAGDIVALVDPLTGSNFNPILPNPSGLFNLQDSLIEWQKQQI